MSIYIEDPDPKWQKLQRKAPHFLLDTHPSGKYAAMQISTNAGEKAAIWDTQTGEIAWKPKSTLALCWVQTGQNLLAVSEAEPYLVELWTWPEPTSKPLFLFEATLDLPAGWVNCLVASPTANRACVVWIDQTEAGIEWVAWDETTIWQENNKGYFGKELNGLYSAVFSPDGKHIVLAYSASYWWFDVDEDGDPEDPSPGGSFRCGKIVICDSQTGAARETELFVDLPEGFLPDDADEGGETFVGRPVFENNERFTVPLGNGEVLAFSVLKGPLQKLLVIVEAFQT